MVKKSLLLLALCLLPLGIVWAQTGTYIANGVTWKYKLESGTATITGETRGRQNFTGALNIPASIEYSGTTYTVTKIGNNAFQEYSRATSVTIPATVTTIGEQAFYYCRGLTGNLSLPNVTTIGQGAFRVCSRLTGLFLPNVTTIGEFAFQQCSGLTGTLSLPNVTTIGKYVFQECSGLTGTLSLPNAITIGELAFDNCSGFTGTLSLPNVTIIERRTFWRCSGLTGLSLPNVTTIGEYAFAECSGLTGILSLPNVTTIRLRAFSSIIGLTGLSLPNVTTIGDEVFQGCDSLTGTLYLPNITTIERRTFWGCDGLKHLRLPATIKVIKTYAFTSCSALETVTFEAGATLTTLEQECFAANSSLKYIDMSNVTLPTGITASRANGCFKNSLHYTMVYLPAGTLVEANQVNFVSGNTCNNFVVYDNKQGKEGCDYPIQHPFTATKASYDRTFTGATCKTICLPYPATLPAGFRAYELMEKSGGGTRFRFVSIGDGGTQLQANKPYLVRIVDGSASKRFNTVDNNVSVPVTPATIEVPATADGTIFFGGTTTNIDNATAAAGGYYNLKDNGWYPIKTNNTEGRVNSFRGYIRTTGGAPAKGFSIVLDDETTDIDSPEQDPEQSITQGKGNIYTLDGRFAGTDVKALKSGEIYVKNGKKFYKH